MSILFKFRPQKLEKTTKKINPIFQRSSVAEKGKTQKTSRKPKKKQYSETLALPFPFPGPLENCFLVFFAFFARFFFSTGMFLPRASERKVLPIVGLCKTSSDLHIFSSSHLLIFRSSHLHIFSSSNLLILTSSHPHIFSSSSHLHIFSSSHLLIFTSSHLHIFSSSHLLIFTSSHPQIFSSSSHLLIFTSSHLHIFSSSHLLLIFSSSHLLLFTSSPHLLIFTSSHILTSSPHLPIFTSSHLHIFSSCPLALSSFSISLLKAGLWQDFPGLRGVGAAAERQKWHLQYLAAKQPKCALHDAFGPFPAASLKACGQPRRRHS